MGIQVLSLRCILRDRFGQVLSQTISRDVITKGTIHDQTLRSLAVRLEGIQKGETRTIPLSASEAYGPYDPQLVITRARDDVPRNATLKVGDPVLMQVVGKPPKLFRVVELSPETVQLDGNHPFAGQDLVFEIEALEAREATTDEIREAEGQLEIPAFH